MMVHLVICQCIAALIAGVLLSHLHRSEVRQYVEIDFVYLLQILLELTLRSTIVSRISTHGCLVLTREGGRLPGMVGTYQLMKTVAVGKVLGTRYICSTSTIACCRGLAASVVDMLCCCCADITSLRFLLRNFI